MLGNETTNQARLAEQLGDWDEAVVQYLELVRSDPGELSYRSALLRAKIQASHLHFERAKQYQEAKAFRRALVELQQAVQLDPTNQYAFVELQKVRLEVENELRERDALTSLDAKSFHPSSQGGRSTGLTLLPARSKISIPVLSAGLSVIGCAVADDVMY